MTVTSGLRKCPSAVMAAMLAQSSMLPSSSRKCTSTRIDQTWVASLCQPCAAHTRGLAHGERTLCPATMHSASRSTASLFRNAFSSNLARMTSSSEALRASWCISSARRKTRLASSGSSPPCFVAARRHGGDLGRNNEEALVWSVLERLDDLCRDLYNDSGRRAGIHQL